MSPLTLLAPALGKLFLGLGDYWRSEHLPLPSLSLSEWTLGLVLHLIDMLSC